MKIRVPERYEQDRIVELLQSLDGRIDVLRQTNATLESIAQTLFKSWFIDFDPVRAKAEGRELEGMDAATAALFPREFEESASELIPKGWLRGTLDDLADLNARSWTARRAPTEVAYIDLASVKSNVFDRPQRFLFTDAPSRARRELSARDTIVGTVRPGNRSFGFIAQAEEGLTASTGFAVLSPRKSIAAAFTYLCATRDENIDRLSALADGGAYPAVSPELVLGTSCTLPPDALMEAFASVAGPLLDAVAANTARARLLAELRDTLLPRLVSGKLCLSEAREPASEALE
jgi:type I restriction enzyme S subunit